MVIYSTLVNVASLRGLPWKRCFHPDQPHFLGVYMLAVNLRLV